MNLSATIILISIYSLFFTIYIHAQSSFPLTPYTACSSPNARYDINTFSCVTCPINTQSSLFNSLTECQCTVGTASTPIITTAQQVAASGYPLLACTSCTSMGMASSHDGLQCMSCNSPSVLGSGGDCVCPSGSIVVEKDIAGNYLSGKTCLSCPSNGYPSTDKYSCIICPSPNMTVIGGVCTCPSGTVIDGTNTNCLSINSVSTINIIAPASIASIMYYYETKDSDGGSTYTTIVNPSYPFSLYYMISAVECTTNYHPTYCSLLANLCILQLYDISRPACNLFLSLSTNIPVPNYGFSGTLYGWKKGLPFGLYSDLHYLTTTDLYSTVTLDSTVTSTRSSEGYLSYKLMTYALTGELLSISDLTTQFQFCNTNADVMTNYLRFGVNYQNKCNLNLNNLLNTYNTTLFYQLFIIDLNNQIYPVPVQILNYKLNGVNVNNNPSNPQQLSNRFFLIDVDSSKSTASTPTVLVYADSITLSVSMQSNNKNIYPPLLIIHYSQRMISNIVINNAYSAVSFNMEYNKDFSNIWTAGTVLFSLACIGAIFLAYKRYIIWHTKNRNIRLEINLSFIIKLLFYYFNSWGELMLLVLMVLCFYCFLFYKGQQQIYLLLPQVNSSECNTLGKFLIACFISKLLQVLYRIYEQIGEDLFFLDWEKTKDNNNNNNNNNNRSGADYNNNYNNDNTNNFNNTSNRSNINNNNNPNTNNYHQNSAELENVSVWRKVLAVRKWCQLQTLRYFNSNYALIYMIFLLYGLNLQYLASNQPTFTINASTTTLIHPILLFAITSFFLGLFYIFYYLLLFYAYYRYVPHPAITLIDYLTINNISLFIFDESYHAYYLHGQSVHLHADVNMKELLVQIAQEKYGYTKNRGLIDGKSIFSLYYSTEWYAHVSNEYLDLMRREREGKRKGRDIENERKLINGDSKSRSIENIERAEMNDRIIQRLLQAGASLNQFLSAFIEKQLPSYPYEFGEINPWRKTLGLPVVLPETSAISTMFDDSSTGFLSVLPMGMEWDFTLLLITLFSMCDFIWGSIIVSTLVCFVVDNLLMFIRGYFGRLNVSRKTFIDERFIM